MPYRYLGDDLIRVPAALDRTKLTFPALAQFVKKSRSDWTRKMGENIRVTQRFRPGALDVITIYAYDHAVASVFESDHGPSYTLHYWDERMIGPMPDIARWIRLHVEQDNK